MNRSFRQPEKAMTVPVKQRQPQLNGSFRNSALRDKEEELGLFLEMKKREKERCDLLMKNVEAEFDSSHGSRTGNVSIYSMPSATTIRNTGADEFLNSENDKNDYEWLLTPPGTPLFPSLEMESPKTVANRNGTQKANRNGTQKAQSGALRSRLSSSTQPETTGRNGLSSRPRAASPAPSTGLRRPSSSGAAGTGSGSGLGSGSRPSTPTGRPVSGTQARTISNVVTKSNPASTTSVRPRSSTPISRPVNSSSKPTPPARSTARPSTPTSRPSLSLSTTKPTPQRPAVSSNVTKTSAPVKPSVTVTNSASSPSARPRPWKPQEMPGYTLDAPPNLRTSLSDRPISSIRGRAGAPNSRSSSIEPMSNGRVRRQSCSPSRGRLPTGVTRKSGSSVPIPALNRAYAKANDNVSPGMYGTKMVERVVNMRKLAPPKQDDKHDKHSPHSNLSAKSSSSPDTLDFGRSLSKKSLDMAMRHMDIRRTLPGNLRPLMTKIPASSMYSVRSRANTKPND